MPEFTALTWNVHLSDIYPQSQRIDSIRETLLRLHRKHPLDALGLQEVEGNNGEVIAEALFGNQGAWRLHSRDDLQEHIGMAGVNLSEVEFFDLGHHKTAALAYLGSTALVTTHLRRQPKLFPFGPEQIEQVGALLERVEDIDQVLLGGDWNCLWNMLPRKMIENAGFEPAFTQLPGKNHPKTFPAPGFEALIPPEKRVLLKLARGAINLDGFYTKGLKVVDGGTGIGPSDHSYVWVTVDDDPQT
ncbi:MAG TPA: endonuclease/exonuclease/phosphatase family protein [Candidatus Saccharibacteria bacterium]|nr:endonuclease/exonuclease/phosphatase family protein [Candidatus Saccharibacteria bacterium]HRK94022.1 endonuclease/exonuclease/phosphatase family protein [Candidatus Saccharibacteria bacterium]